MRSKWILLLIVWSIRIPISAQSVKAGEKRVVSNVAAFGKLYGYLRYFYPGDNAASLNWDRLAVYGTAKVGPAKNTRELQKALSELFKPIAPELSIDTISHRDTKTSQIHPDTNMVAWQHLGYGRGLSNYDYKSIRTQRTNYFNQMLGFCYVSQNIPADNFRKKNFRVSVKACLKGDIVSKGVSSLFLSVSGTGGKLFEKLVEINGSEWKAYTVSAEIPESATVIRIAIRSYIEEPCAVWADDIQCFSGNDERVPISNADFEMPDSSGYPPVWKYINNNDSYRIGIRKEGSNQFLTVENRPFFPFNGKLFPEVPASDAMLEKEISAGLYCRFPLSLSSQSAKESTPGFTQLSIALANLKETDPGSRDVRMANVIIAWNIFKNFYPYRESMRGSLFQALPQFLAEAYLPGNYDTHKHTLQKMVSLLNDAHAGVYDGVFAGNSHVPACFEWIENKLVVTGTTAMTQLLIGDIIEKINGVSCRESIPGLRPFISGAEHAWRNKAIEYLSTGNHGDSIVLTINRNGKLLPMNVKKDIDGNVLPFLPDPFASLENGLFYIDMSRITMDLFIKRLPELRLAKGIIADIRNYPRGTNGILSYFAKDSLILDPWASFPKIIYPDMEKIPGYSETVYTIPKAPERLDARVVFLSGNGTRSNGESLLMIVRKYKLGKIIGEQSAGANGQTNTFLLFGGYRIVWSGMYVKNPDGSDFHAIGIKPDIIVRRKLASVKQQKDDVIEAAVKYFKPMQ